MALADALLPPNWRNADPDRPFAAGARLSLALAVVHLGLVALALCCLAGPWGVGGWDRLPGALAFGLHFGQVGHPMPMS